MRYMALSLIMASLLAGCSASSPRIEYIPVYDDVPKELLEPTVIPRVELVTNEDLARAYLGAKRAAMSCNADKESLRVWANGRLGQGQE